MLYFSMEVSVSCLRSSCGGLSQPYAILTGLTSASINQLWMYQGQPNTYKVASKSHNTGFNDTIVTFVNHDNAPIDLPDPKIFALYAAFANVFYASGAGEYIGSSLRDMDMIGVLSTDGTTDFQPLNVALQILVTV